MRLVPKTLTGKALVAVPILLLLTAVALGISWVHARGRWPVKTGADSDACLVNLERPVRTDVAALAALDRPPATPRSRRVAPVETTVYVVSATLVQFKREPDGDYHLVIRGEDGSTMITEIPDPQRVRESSPFRDQITRARAAFDARFDASRTWQSANVPVLVTGVGFFDFPHGQTGAAPNYVELHPVLDIQFP